MEENKNDHIIIEKVSVGDREAVSIEMYGDMHVLTSIMYSAMKSNQQLAQVVMHAAQAYYNSEQRESAMN